MEAMLQDVGGGGESDMATVEPEGDGGLFFLRRRTTLGNNIEIIKS